MRGVVLIPEDLTFEGWPRLVKQSGLTTIGIHHQHSPAVVVKLMNSDIGRKFFSECESLGLEVEYELHAMMELLPRSLFEKNPEMFRMDDAGQRIGDRNLCVHSKEAMEIICENAVNIARTLRPTTGRYFYWGDDGKPWCHCPKCRHLSDSDQAMLVNNAILKALRKHDGRATLAHLSYANTLFPPQQVRPDKGIFLEFAPMHRRWDIPLESKDDPRHVRALEALDANMEVFDGPSAQVLEYWIDASLRSNFERPAVRVDLNSDVLAADVEAYRRRGITRITSFACFIDADYVQRHGLPPVEEYGRILANA